MKNYQASNWNNSEFNNIIDIGIFKDISLNQMNVKYI